MVAIENPEDRAHPDERLFPIPAADVPADAATVHPPADAASDFGARFAQVFAGLGDRNPSVDALFEVLLLETPDWGVDQQVKVKPIR